MIPVKSPTATIALFCIQNNEDIWPAKVSLFGLGRAVVNRQVTGNLLDLVTMQQELQQFVQRDVDLIEKRSIEKSENWIRRNEILNTAQVIYSQAYEPA